MHCRALERIVYNSMRSDYFCIPPNTNYEFDSLSVFKKSIKYDKYFLGCDQQLTTLIRSHNEYILFFFCPDVLTFSGFVTQDEMIRLRSERGLEARQAEKKK